jgi:hypothetical protein
LEDQPEKVDKKIDLSNKIDIKRALASIIGATVGNSVG